MWPMTASPHSIGAFQADALFASGLQRSDCPSAVHIRRAIIAAIRKYGSSGCAAQVAQEFGDHPETAAIRMRWARAMAREAFTEPAPGAVSRADAGRLLVVRPGLAAEQASASPGAGRRERTGREDIGAARLALGSQTLVRNQGT